MDVGRRGVVASVCVSVVEVVGGGGECLAEGEKGTRVFSGGCVLWRGGVAIIRFDAGSSGDPAEMAFW